MVLGSCSCQILESETIILLLVMLEICPRELELLLMCMCYGMWVVSWTVAFHVVDYLKSFFAIRVCFSYRHKTHGM